MLQKVSEQIVYCYERASESRAKAAGACNEASQREYLEMERRWLALARSHELSERITTFNEENRRQLRVLIPSAPPHPAIPRVTCAVCSKKMRLTQIEPSLKREHVVDIATFTCTCGFSCQQIADGPA